MTKRQSFIWAKSEPEQRELEKLGWTVAEQRATHHSVHALLMKWAGKGEPKLSQNPAVRA